MKPRTYQFEAVAELLIRLRSKRKVVAVGPTGSGKTVIGTALALAMAPARVLWVAHRIELIRQALEHLVSAGFGPRDLGVVCGQGSVRLSDGTTINRNLGARVVVVSVGAFRSCRTVPDADLIVVDEAHHVAAESYRKILTARPRAMLLGLTATPWRLDGEPLGNAFDDLFVIAEAQELIVDGYIAESIVYGIPEDKALALVAGLGLGSQDWSKVSAAAVMRKRPIMADIVTEWHRLARGLPTIVYACSVEHAAELVARFRESGVAAEALDWTTEAEQRASVIRRLGSGETAVVVNVTILTEGFDCPPVKCIVLARPTKSLTLYRQMCGRGSRSVASGERPLILDHAGNVWRHGLPESPMPWSLSGRVKLGGEAPVKRCPATAHGHECGVICPIAAKYCWKCGSEFPLTQRELTEQQIDLERIQAAGSERTRREKILRALAASRGLDEAWVQRWLAA